MSETKVNFHQLRLKIKTGLLTSVSEIKEDVQEAPSLGPIPSRHAAGTAMRCQATKLELVLGLLFLERQRCAVGSRNTAGVIPSCFLLFLWRKVL